MTVVEIPNVEDIKKQIKELQELLVVAYRLDPKYRCPTCGGSGNVVTEYWSGGHAAERIAEGCPDCLGRGYNIGPEKNGGKMTKKCPSSPSPAPSFSAPF